MIIIAIQILSSVNSRLIVPDASERSLFPSCLISQQTRLYIYMHPRGNDYDVSDVSAPEANERRTRGGKRWEGRVGGTERGRKIVRISQARYIYKCRRPYNLDDTVNDLRMTFIANLTRLFLSPSHARGHSHSQTHTQRTKSPRSLYCQEFF